MKNFRPQHRPKKSSLVIGRKAVLEAMKNGQALERIYLHNKAVGEDVAEIRNRAGSMQVPLGLTGVISSLPCQRIRKRKMMTAMKEKSNCFFMMQNKNPRQNRGQFFI